MDRRSLILASALAAVGTLLLYLTPMPYQYPPVVAALAVVIGLRCSPGAGMKVGVTMGLWTGVGAIGLAILLVGIPELLSGSGAAELTRAMDGAGPRNVIFYAVFAYFLGVYTALTGGVVGAMAGLAPRLPSRLRRPPTRSDVDEAA
jgi:hypothetical protein